MKITILVPTLGIRKKQIDRLLRSLNAQVYKNFEVIFVSQCNHDYLEKKITDFPDMEIKHIKLYELGLSKARNAGLKIARGDIVVLSDDDCWYPKDALNKIVNIFKADASAKIVLTQIFDKEKHCPYKAYPHRKQYINNRFMLLSKSSIEIAFKKDEVKQAEFDEKFGLGSIFVCGEEIDFLIKNFERNKYIYVPTITVYHSQKLKNSNKEQIIAKGALYAKNFNIVVSIMVLIKDLLLKKECNFKSFFEGYIKFEKIR